jgi:hypothetical protein
MEQTLINQIISNQLKWVINLLKKNLKIPVAASENELVLSENDVKEI